MAQISPFYYLPEILNGTPFGEYYDENYDLNWNLSGQLDLDGDGDYEIIVAGVVEGGVDTTFAGPIIVLDYKDGYIADVGPDVIPQSIRSVVVRDFVVGDFNNDGIDDLFVNNHGSEKDDPFRGEQNYLLMSDGAGRLTDATDKLPQVTDFSHGSFAADFNNDDLLDIFVNNLGEDDLTGSYVLMNLGNGDFSPPEWTSTHPFGAHMQSTMFDDAFNKLYGGAYFPAVLDMNNDGNIDIWYGEVLDTRTNKFTQFYAENDGGGNFTLVQNDDFADPIINQYGLSQESAEWGDLDNDGDLDLLVYAVNAGTDGATYFQYFENRGEEGFAEVSHRIEGQENNRVLDASAGGPIFQLHDFDADGDLDIIHKRWSPDFTEDVAFWFSNDGNGNFSRIDDELFPARQHFQIADVNGDWLPDIVYEIREWFLPKEYELTGESSYSQFQLGALSTGVNRKGWGTDDRIAGGDYKDKLMGRGGDDALKGNGGNDKIIGANGRDLIFGDDGSDVLLGGKGVDNLNGGAGGDVLSGGKSHDLLKGGSGADELSGGSGDDSLNGGSGADKLVGGSGADTLSGGSGNDVLNGGKGHDLLKGGGGKDQLIGSSGNDTLIGNGGNDTLSGGSGNDSLSGGNGRDYLDGGTGDDILTGGKKADIFALDIARGGNDTITDMKGADTLVFYEKGDVLETGTAEAFVIEFASVSEDGVFFDFGGSTLLLTGVETLEELYDNVSFDYGL